VKRSKNGLKKKLGNMKYKKKFHDYYIQRKLILEIFKNPKIIKEVLGANITAEDFEDEDLREIFEWIISRYKENKKVSLIYAQVELRDIVGDMNKYIPFPGGDFDERKTN
jgi:hypothetical protein